MVHICDSRGGERRKTVIIFFASKSTFNRSSWKNTNEGRRELQNIKEMQMKYSLQDMQTNGNYSSLMLCLAVLSFTSSSVT